MINFCNDIVKPYTTYCDKSFIDSIRNRLFLLDPLDNDYVNNEKSIDSIMNMIHYFCDNVEQQKKNIRHERYEYFTGKADPEVYIENPFPKKIRDKDTLQKYLDADEKLSQVCLKIDYYETILNYLESILKVIQNRTYQIKNAIEFLKFQAGYG